MATESQRQAARRNVEKAQRAARNKRTISKLSRSTRSAQWLELERPVR